MLQAQYLTGIRPWSWYIAITTSNAPWRARMNTVSGACGPLTSSPSARACHRGRDLLDFLASEQAALARVRVEAGHRDARGGRARAARQMAGGDAQRLQHIGRS
jgi:hypothetical protein